MNSSQAGSIFGKIVVYLIFVLFICAIIAGEAEVANPGGFPGGYTSGQMS